MPNPILKYQPTGGVTRSVGPVITSPTGNGDEGTPILGYHPGGGSTGGIGTIGQRNGYLYYWPDIENLTGSVPQTDLEAQDISVLPSESLIIVITGVDGDETHWRRMPDYSSPTTDLGLGIIVPLNYDSETRPWVLLQELTGVGGAGANAFGTVTVGGTDIVADSATDRLTLVAGTNITLTPDAFADSVTIATIGGGGGGSGNSMSSSVTQTVHGFAVGNVLRYTGTAYAKAQADVAANAEVVGLVTAVVDANNFTLTTGGAVTGLSGLTAGSVYFLSTTTPGLLTTTAPAVTNQVSKPLLVAISATGGYFFNWRGWVVGSAAAVDGGGGSGPVSNAYGTVKVTGQSDVVAATASDILTLAAGTNVTLTTNAATDTVTIAATGGGAGSSTTGTGFWHNTTGALDAASRAIDLSTADVTGNLDKAHLNSGTGATSSTFWRGDNTWATPAGGGNVSTSGTITTGQYPRWASATTLESVTTATVRTDLGLVIGTNVQAFDADLTTWAGITPTTVGQSFVTLANPGAITFPEISATNVVSAKTAAQLKTDLSLTATDVGLGNVTNNAQTQAAIVPNTAPTSGQILIGNVGNTAYAKNTLSGSGATITLGATGVLTISAIPESSLSITNVTTGDATTSAHGFAPKGTVGTTQFWRQDWTLATPGGTGTVTATGGALTANSVVLGAGTTDTKVVGGIITDGTSKLTLGVSTTSVGSIALNNLTSGSVTIQPATGALSTATMTIPAGSTNPVVADTGAASNFLTGISTAGVITKAQPAFTNLTGSVAATQMPALTGDVTTSAGAVATTIAANAVTYAKMQAISATSKLLGSSTTTTPVQEVTLGTNLSMSGATLNAALAAAGGSITYHGNSSYTILNTDKIVATNAAFTSIWTWTMPLASSVSAGNSISIIDLAASWTGGNGINLTRAGSDVFMPMNVTTLGLLQAGQGVQVTSDGVSKWYVTYNSQGFLAGQGTGAVQMWDNTNRVWSIAPVGITGLTPASPAAGKILQSDGTNFNKSTPTWPTAAGTAGKVVISDGTNLVSSTPTYPNAATPTARKMIVSDGTNWVASTETWAVPGTSGNVLTSNGTNWLSSAPAGGGNVSNVATPANDQLAVWTGATTIEGDANLTWTGTATGVLKIGGTDVGLSRNGAGVLEIDSGTAGTYRDLILRNLTITGTGSVQATSSSAGDVTFRNTVAAARTVIRASPNGSVVNSPASITLFGTDWIADSTNFEYCYIASKGSGDTYYQIGTSAAGTGTRRPLSINADNTATQMVFSTTGPITIGGTDVGFARNTAGVLEIDSGTAGTYRDLKLRNLVLSGGTQIPAASPTGLFLKDDGTYAAPAVGGNVSNSGAPVADQVAIWTGATTLKGDPILTASNYLYWTYPGAARTGLIINNTDATSKSGAITFQANGVNQWNIISDTNSNGGLNFLIRDVITAGTPAKIFVDASGVHLPSVDYLGWSSASAGGSGCDTAFMRNGVGIVEINNGNAGTYRDLKLRTLSITGATTVNVSAPATLTGAFLKDDGTWAIPGGAGNVSNSGVPTAGQMAQWVTSTAIKGVTLSGSGATMSIDTSGVLSISAIASASIVGTLTGKTLSTSTFDNTNTYTAKDGSFTLQNTTTTTKQAIFSLANITAANTRTITIPDANSNTVIPDTGAANNFLTGISTAGVITKAQPTYANLTGLGGSTTQVLYNNAGAISSITGATTDGTKMILVGPQMSGSIFDANAVKLIALTATASAANWFGFANAALTFGPTITTAGGDTNINLNITPKGTGIVNIANGIQIGGSALNFSHLAGTAATGQIPALGSTPTVSVGLTAVAGSATTYIRTDGAPALSQAIAPTWTGVHTFSPTARSSGASPYFVLNIPADTGQTLNTESIGYRHVTATRSWSSGAVALQRENYFAGPTYDSPVSVSFTDTFTLYLDKPIPGANAIFTRGHSLGIVDSTSATSAITGGLVVATTLGTAATSVGIGGGNINAGGTITGGSTINAVTGYQVNGASLNFSHLAGSAAAAQMPAYTGDVTSSAGATANTLVNIPATTTIAGVAGTRGDVLYYGASGWAKLAAGTSGNQLTTNGAGADPTWAAPGAGGSGSPGGSTLQLQYNNAGAFGGMSGTSWDDTNRSLTVSGATVTTDKPLLDLSQTWNAGGVTFTGLRVNAISTASAAGSLLADFQKGGTSQVSIRNDGYVQVVSGLYWPAVGHLIANNASNVEITSAGATKFINGGNYWSLASGGLFMGANNSIFGWQSTGTPVGTTADTALARNAAGVVEVNNGTLGTYRDIIARTHNATSGYQINGIATAGDYINSSVSSQTPAAVDVYVAGSSIVVPAGAFAAKGQYRCVFDIVKSAGTGTVVVSLRIGTTGTVASDTARITFTFPAAGTTVADTGNIEVCVNWRTVGSGTSAVVSGFCRAAKNTVTAAGLWSTTSAALTIVGTVSGGFDSSAATTIGLSFNGSTAFAGTITTVQASLAQ